MTHETLPDDSKIPTERIPVEIYHGILLNKSFVEETYPTKFELFAKKDRYP